MSEALVVIVFGGVVLCGAGAAFLGAALLLSEWNRIEDQRDRLWAERMNRRDEAEERRDEAEERREARRGGGA